MPGYLLHDGAVVLCAHGGQSKPVLKNPRIKVSGFNIVTQTCIYSVSGCSFPPPPNGNGPCVTASWTTASIRVKANGLPVLLADSQAICTPTATNLMISFTQIRVKGQ